MIYTVWHTDAIAEPGESPREHSERFPTLDDAKAFANTFLVMGRIGVRVLDETGHTVYLPSM